MTQESADPLSPAQSAGLCQHGQALVPQQTVEASGFAVSLGHLGYTRFTVERVHR